MPRGVYARQGGEHDRCTWPISTPWSDASHAGAARWRDERHAARLYIIGASSRPYRDVVAVVDAARGAGVQRVGIVTESMRKSG
jgi:hypothetical protein